MRRVSSSSPTPRHNAVTFKPAFAGFKWIFMYASGISGPNSDWQIRGSW